MRILVTGGLGFIGSNFIHHIIENRNIERIISIDSNTYAANKGNLNITSFSRYKLINIQSDINNTALVRDILNVNQITHIVHFAAESHVDNSIADPAAFIKSNINGTFSLLEAVRTQSRYIRFHHISTDEVFGSLGKEGLFTEKTPYNPRSPYSASKAASDHLVNAYYHTYGLPITMSNCSNNYGPRQHEEKLIPKIIKNLLSGKKVPIYGNGQNIRDWLYVYDHCSAIWNILTNGKVGESYNIGGNCERNNIQILETICNLMNLKFENHIEYVEDRKGHDFRYAIDFSKIKNELDWTPKFSFTDGILKTLEYYAF